MTVLLFLLIILLPLALFIARDGFFQGRSPGKQLFGLCCQRKKTRKNIKSPTII